MDQCRLYDADDQDDITADLSVLPDPPRPGSASHSGSGLALQRWNGCQTPFLATLRAVAMVGEGPETVSFRPGCHSTAACRLRSTKQSLGQKPRLRLGLQHRRGRSRRFQREDRAPLPVPSCNDRADRPGLLPTRRRGARSIRRIGNDRNCCQRYFKGLYLDRADARISSGRDQARRTSCLIPHPRGVDYSHDRTA